MFIIFKKYINSNAKKILKISILFLLLFTIFVVTSSARVFFEKLSYLNSYLRVFQYVFDNLKVHIYGEYGFIIPVIAIFLDFAYNVNDYFSIEPFFAVSLTILVKLWLIFKFNKQHYKYLKLDILIYACIFYYFSTDNAIRFSLVNFGYLTFIFWVDLFNLIGSLKFEKMLLVLFVFNIVVYIFFRLYSLLPKAKITLFTTIVISFCMVVFICLSSLQKYEFIYNEHIENANSFYNQYIRNCMANKLDMFDNLATKDRTYLFTDIFPAINNCIPWYDNLSFSLMYYPFVTFIFMAIFNWFFVYLGFMFYIMLNILFKKAKNKLKLKP